MFQETAVTWDLVEEPSPLSTSEMVYVVLLIVAIVLASVRLVRAWKTALPFRFSREKASRAYLCALRQSALRTKMWMYFAILSWPLLLAFRLIHDLDGLLSSHTVSPTLVFSEFKEIVQLSVIFLFPAFILFLAWWHLQRRAESLES